MPDIRSLPLEKMGDGIYTFSSNVSFEKSFSTRWDTIARYVHNSPAYCGYVLKSFYFGSYCSSGHKDIRAKSRQRAGEEGYAGSRWRGEAETLLRSVKESPQLYPVDS